MKSSPPRRPYGLIALIVALAVAMTVATVCDYWATDWLGAHPWRFLARIMGRTLFEGQRPGANDPVILLLLAAAGIYYLGWKKPSVTGLAAWRPQAGFALVTALVTAVMLVHGLKWTMGRARPDLVFNHGLAFSHWFTFGPHFITQGIFRGSFPSGHTSQIFVLMSGAYILAGDPLLSRPLRWTGRVVGVLVVGLSLAMGLGRCMTLSHWLTDVVGSISLGWVIIHLLYFHALFIPDQHRYMRASGRMPDLPEVWEIRLCVWYFLTTIGLMLIVNGLRGLFLGHGIGFAAAVPVGMAAVWIGQKRARALGALVKIGLNSVHS